MLCILVSCKKESKEPPYPSASYLEFTVDNATYKYAGKELGGTFAKGNSVIPANFMMYTMGLVSTKPGFYIRGDAPGLTTVGKYLVVTCDYNVSNNGPYYHVRDSLNSQKSNLNITRVSPDELKFEGNFDIELIDSTNNVVKQTKGSFGIVIQ